jgi:hypothetical protein
MIQIRQAKHSATVIRLNSLFTHDDDGLPNAAPLGRGRQHGRCNQPWDRTGFDRYRLVTPVACTSAIEGASFFYSRVSLVLIIRICLVRVQDFEAVGWIRQERIRMLRLTHDQKLPAGKFEKNGEITCDLWRLNRAPIVLTGIKPLHEQF